MSKPIDIEIPHRPVTRDPDCPVTQWITGTLWDRWGWEGWMADDFQRPYRDEIEKDRIESAARFLVRALAHSDRDGTDAVVDSIVARRKARREGRP